MRRSWPSWLRPTAAALTLIAWLGTGAILFGPLSFVAIGLTACRPVTSRDAVWLTVLGLFWLLLTGLLSGLTRAHHDQASLEAVRAVTILLVGMGLLACGGLAGFARLFAADLGRPDPVGMVTVALAWFFLPLVAVALGLLAPRIFHKTGLRAGILATLVALALTGMFAGATALVSSAACG